MPVCKAPVLRLQPVGKDDTVDGPRPVYLVTVRLLAIVIVLRGRLLTCSLPIGTVGTSFLASLASVPQCRSRAAWIT